MTHLKKHLPDQLPLLALEAHGLAHGSQHGSEEKLDILGTDF